MNKSKLLSVLLILSMTIVPMMSCQNSKHREIKASHADSVIFATGVKKQYEQMIELATSAPEAAKYLDGMDIVKTIAIPKRIVNIVLKPKA